MVRASQANQQLTPTIPVVSLPVMPQQNPKPGHNLNSTAGANPVKNHISHMHPVKSRRGLAKSPANQGNPVSQGNPQLMPTLVVSLHATPHKSPRPGHSPSLTLAARPQKSRRGLVKSQANQESPVNRESQANRESPANQAMGTPLAVLFHVAQKQTSRRRISSNAGLPAMLDLKQWLEARTMVTLLEMV